MRPRYWLLTTISMILIAAAAIAGLNMGMDVYGLYRPTHGRRLPVLGDPRIAKYLLSANYVPENFNALLSGASISANWDLTTIERLRVFNESLGGGNIIEEKALIEAALEKPGVSVVFLLVHPAMTYSHDFHTVDLKHDLRRSALGSLSLLDVYKEMVNIRLGRLPPTFNHAGTETYMSLHTEFNIHMKKMWGEAEFNVDPVALQAYLDLVSELRARKLQVVFIVPPTSQRLLEVKRPALDRYVERMRTELGSGDLWIDFMSEEYDGFCRDTANFSDGVHLRPDGARQVVAHINTALNRWSAEGRLPAPQH